RLLEVREPDLRAEGARQVTGAGPRAGQRSALGRGAARCPMGGPGVPRRPGSPGALTAAVGATRRLPCAARPGVARRNSLRSLRELRSDNRRENDERSALRAPP